MVNGKATLSEQNHAIEQTILVVILLLLIALETLIVLNISNLKPFRDQIARTSGVDTLYFEATKDWVITPRADRSAPNISQAKILNWTSDKIIQLLSLDYVNYQEHLQDHNAAFTVTGWGQFVTMLRQSGLIKNIIDHHFVTLVIPTRAPFILSEGIDNNHYTWRVEMYFNLYQQALTYRHFTPMKCTLLIEKISDQYTPTGLVINEFSLTQDQEKRNGAHATP